jgi:hypothetical protein
MFPPWKPSFCHMDLKKTNTSTPHFIAFFVADYYLEVSGWLVSMVAVCSLPGPSRLLDRQITSVQCFSNCAPGSLECGWGGAMKPPGEVY